ncbi:hypothetical protein Tco_0164980, partial [Tanacetum coccineum]
NDIRGEQYYNAYLEKVAKHQRYLAGNQTRTKREVFGMPIPNDLITNDIREVSDPDSPAPKPAKATKPKATKQSKPQLPKPTPATTEPSKVKENSEAPSPAKRPKAGKVIKKRKSKSSLQLIDELVDEGVPGPLPSVVIREHDSRKFQPLPDFQGKGKEKVSDEQVALDLLTL